jgi:hypothetical protein
MRSAVASSPAGIGVAGATVNAFRGWEGSREVATLTREHVKSSLQCSTVAPSKVLDACMIWAR